MTPILFAPEMDEDALLDVNSQVLEDANGEQLLAVAPLNVAGQRSFSDFGLGVMTDCVSCEVTEERNGEYELVMEYPMNGVVFDDIQARCVILAKPNHSDQPQPFRIYRISAPIGGVITINAQHLSYDLSGVPVKECEVNAIAGAAVATLHSNTMFTTPFIFGTYGPSSRAMFAVTEPSSIRSWFGGREGSLIDVYGGEWKFDRYYVDLYAQRGSDRGVVIRYGKNLIDIEQETNLANMWTGVLAYWKNADIGQTVKTDIINAPGSFDYRRIQCVDMSAEFEETPTKEELTAKAQSYITSNNIGKPSINITLDWVQVGELEDQVDLCDTVTVIFEKLGIDAKAKVISTTWDVLADRYTRIEIGDVKQKVTDTIAGMQKEEKNTISTFNTRIQKQNQTISDLEERVAALEGN